MRKWVTRGKAKKALAAFATVAAFAKANKKQLRAAKVSACLLMRKRAAACARAWVLVREYTTRAKIASCKLVAAVRHFQGVQTKSARFLLIRLLTNAAFRKAIQRKKTRCRDALACAETQTTKPAAVSVGVQTEAYLSRQNTQLESENARLQTALAQLQHDFESLQWNAYNSMCGLRDWVNCVAAEWYPPHQGPYPQNHRLEFSIRRN